MALYRYIVAIALFLFFASWVHAANNISSTLQVVPQSSATGENTIHKIQWRTINPVDVRGRFVIYYKPSFNLTQLIMATTLDSATMDGRLNIDKIDATDPNWKKVYISRKDRQTNGEGLVGINLAMIGNPAPGAYSFMLKTYAAGVDPDLPTSAPEDSGATTITINPPISTFQLTSSVTNPKAGVSFQLNVTNARDAEGNPADGIINISFESGTIQDHAAPDGTLPALVSVAVQNGSGSASQTLYKDEANYIRLRGQVSGGTFSTLTGQLNVGPGDIGSFDMTGYPTSTVAGLDFTSAVTVTVRAFDKWRNPKIDYAGQVYFDSHSDPNALFTNDRQNPYTFSGAQDGVATFDGQDFEFRTAGNQTYFVSNYEQTVIEESNVIQVVAGTMQSFAFETIQNQKAGQAFLVRVVNARDALNNPASGTITVSLVGGGDHRAPNGQLPVLNNIQVVNGSGSAYQSLLKTETLQMGGQASPSVTANSNIFTVTPADLGSLGLSGYPQQTQTNVAFTQGVTVTAYDIYQNPKTDFSQTIHFTSTDPGATLPADYKFNLSASHLFPGSQFKLITIGSQTITVTSGTISGTTEKIQVIGPNNIQIQRVYTSSTSVSRGQLQVAVSMDVLNNGTDPFENYSANLNFKSGLQNVNSDYVVQSSNSTGTIAAGSLVTISFLVDVSTSATLGDITLDGSIGGYYKSVFTQATNANITDTWQVQQPAALMIQSVNVVADTIPKGSSGNEIRLALMNNSGSSSSANALIDNISFTFTDPLFANVSAEFPITASPSNPTSIAGGDTSEFVFYLESKGTAPSGRISMSMQITYRDANLLTSKSLLGNGIDSFESITSAALRITNITSEESTVTRGQTKPFWVEMAVRNEGGSSIQISFNPAKTFIKFRRGGVEYITPNDVEWPVTLKSGAVSIAPGATDILQFRIVQVQSSVPAGDLTIFGRAESVNGIYSTSELSDVYGQVRVQEPENIIIQRMMPSQQTLTVDDDSYPWKVKVVLQNAGGSDVMVSYANSRLNFSKSGFSVSTPALASGDARLNGGETDTLIFPVVRTGGPRGSVTIDANVEFQVINTEQLKNVLASSSGKQTSVLLQNPAELAIVRVRSSIHSVSTNQTPDWSVAVEIENSGEASLEIDIANVDSTWLRFYVGTNPFSTFNIQRPVALAGSGSTLLAGGQRDSLIFRILSNTAAVGTYDLHASVKAIESNRQKRFVYSSLTNPTNTDTVRVTSPANVTYAANTLSPILVIPGRPEAFQLQVTNSGGADVVLDPDRSTFTINAGAQVYEARLDDSFDTTIPGQGSVMLHFEENYLSASFPLNAYVPIVRLIGLENNLPFNQTLNMNGETVTVGEAGEIILQYLRPSTATVTQGQSKAWTVEVGVTNNSAQTLKFKEARLVFTSGISEVSDKFTVQVGNMLTNGTQFLPAGQSSAVLFTIVQVAPSTPPGDVLISGTVTMTDEQETGEVYEATISNKGKVTVQTPAVLEILSFSPSQYSVTTGQTEVWHVGVRVKNSGGSAIKLDPSKMVLDLDGYVNNLFGVTLPTFFVGTSNDTLLGGAEDSLYFRINKVDESLPVTRPGVADSVRMIADIATKVLNTGESLIRQSRKVGVAIQDSARIRIEKFEAMIGSADLVNAGQEFYLRTLVKNTGGTFADRVQKATIKTTTNSPGYFFASGIDTASVYDLAPGDTVWTTPIKVLTPSTANRQGQFTINFHQTLARNTGGPVTIDPALPGNTTVIVTTQNPAVFRIDSVFTDKKTISTGSTLPWWISAPVRNNGNGVVELFEPQVADVEIYNPQGVLQSPASYRLEPQPLGANKRLGLNQSDTLKFLVRETWRGNGDYKIKVTVRAKELNDLTTLLVRADSTNILLSNAAAVRIRETKIDTLNTIVDAQGIAHVNTNQEFFVSTLIRNESGTYIEKIQLVLDTPRSQVVQPDTQEVNILDSNEEEWVRFTVKADATENLTGETIKADVILARTGDGGEAQILQPLDSIAVVKIYKPAQLRLISTENLAPNPQNFVSLGQNFSIRVKVRNEGSEAAKNVALNVTPSQSLVTVQKPTQSLATDLQGGEIDSLDFLINVGNQEGRVDFAAKVETALGVNSRQKPEVLAALDDSTFALLKPGAHLAIDAVRTSEQEITAGDKNNPWFVKVVVSNTGQADLEFVNISPANLTFSRNGEKDEDYKINKPDSLENTGNFILKADSTDTLVYTILRNGSLAGLVNINVLLNAVDLNTNKDLFLSATADGSIDVSADVAVRITNTVAETNVYDKNGYGLVNRGRNFDVAVNVLTGQFGGVDSVIVKLTSNGNSFTAAVYDTITTIEADASAKARFTISADDTWDSSQGEITEQFSAEIIRAYVKGDTTAVQPRDPETGADIAKVRIQTPAELSYFLQVGALGGQLVQVGDEFNVVAKMKNLGRAPIGTGKLTVVPPTGYRVKTAQNDYVQVPVEKSFSWTVDQDTLDLVFAMMAPDTTSGPDSIRAQLTARPLDLNTNQVVALGAIDSVVTVNTVESVLAIQSFAIIDPPGAQDGTLSTEQIFTLQAVVLSAQNLVARQAILELPTLSVRPGYELRTPQVHAINVENDTIQWILQAPNDPVVDTHEFRLRVTGGESGVNFVQDLESVTINRVERKVSLTLQALEIEPKGVLQNEREAHFTRNQRATITTRVENDGQAAYENSGRLEIDLGESGLELISGDAEQEFFDNSEISWEVEAPNAAISGRDIEVRLIADDVQDANSNKAVSVSKGEQSLVVYVNEGGTVEISALDFTANTGEGIDSVSSAQPFIFKAQINTEGVKDNEIRASLYSKKGLFEIIDFEKVIPSAGSHAQSWTVVAPANYEDASDSLYVVVDAVDLQSEMPRSARSRGLYVPVAQRTTFEFVPYISEPIELKGNDKLSTDQEFTLKAEIKHTGADYVKETKDQFVVELIAPPGFILPIEQKVKTISASEYATGIHPTWRMVAPDKESPNLSNFEIRVQKLPRDSFSKDEAIALKANVTFSVRIVEKAKISFYAYLHNNELLDSASVRSGNNFEISGWLVNTGVAGMSGTYQVQLTLPAGFELVDSDSVQTQTADTTLVTWLVKAPRRATTAPDTFDLKILQLPIDEFARTPVDTTNTTAFVQVTLETGALLISNYKLRDNTGVVRGDSSVAILGMSVRNKDASGDTKSFMNSVTLSVEDKLGKLISPRPMISRIAAVRDGDEKHIFAEATAFGDSGKVVFDFAASPIIIEGSAEEKIKFIVDIRPDAEMKDFRLTIQDTADIDAEDEFFIPLTIIAPTDTLPRSIMAVMMDAALDKSFFNYPNPFGRIDNPNTAFVYYLKEDSDVRIHVYTLTGELVKTWEFTRAEHPTLTTAGLHQGHSELLWDGANGMGQPILNGVYLAYISTSNGEQAMTKIAVIR